MKNYLIGMKSVTHIRSVFSQVTWSTNLPTRSTLYYYSTMHTLVPCGTKYSVPGYLLLYASVVGVYTLDLVLVLHIIFIYIIHDVYTENGDNITTRPYTARWL